MTRKVLVIGCWFACSLCSSGLAREQGPNLTNPRPRFWAIVVGIDSYDQKAMSGSAGSVRQSEAMLRWLRTTAGWENSHLLHLADLGRRDPGDGQTVAPRLLPTRGNLEWAFQKWLASRARTGDVVLFYYAGQTGSVVRVDEQTHDARIDYFLLPTDVDPRDVARTGWSLDRALDSFPGKYQMICWLGTAVTGPPAGEAGGNGPRVAPTGRGWLERLVRWPGVTAWLASDRLPESAAENPATLFTQALLEGFGQPKGKRNLAACLRSLHENPKLKQRGFQTMGGVTPDLAVWADQFNQPRVPARPEMLLQVGHAGKITGIVSSSDGRMMISASMDSTLRAWSVEQQALVRVLTGHWVGVTALGLSRDGRWLISGGGRSRVMVNDLTRDFALKRILRQPHESRIERVLVLPDGIHFATIDQNGKSFLWNLNDPVLRAQPWLADQECRREAEGGDVDAGKVAVLRGSGEVRIMGAAGETSNPLIVRPREAQFSAVAVSPDGHWLALGREDGGVLLRDLKSGRQTDQKMEGDPIVQLNISRRETLAVVHEGGVKVYSIAKGLDPDLGTPITDQTARALSFSLSGRYLAVALDNEVSIWDFDGEKPSKAASLAASPVASVLSFSGDDRNLLVGGADGSLSIHAMESPGARVRRIPANRGMVRQVEVAPGRRFVLTRNELNQIQLWDSKDRTCVRLPGYWASAAFQDDETLVASAAGDPENADKPGGWIGRIIWSKLNTNREHFARSASGYSIPETVAFEAVTLSPDRKRMAATVPDSAVPFVGVWDVKSGKLTHWLTQIQDPVRSASFSSDGRFLATAGDSPSAQLWALDAAGGEIKRPAVTFVLPETSNVTCVRIRPGPSHQLVTGHGDGRAILWSWRDSKATAEQTHLVEEVLDGAVRAMVFTPDGRQLVVAGDGTSIWLGELEPRPRAIDLAGRPHHFEQVNSLAAWPDGSLVVSGSDDSTVRFWDLDKRVLRGTFRAATSRADLEEAAKSQASTSTELDWVFYAPDGPFDASAQGRALVRYQQRGVARPMEQFDSTLYTFALGEQLLKEGTPEAIQKPAEPPPLAIDPPLRSDPAQPETELTVLLGSKDLKDVRLYHNGIPVSTSREGEPGGLPERLPIRVKLLQGNNQFYAMASREGAYDSRSPEPDVQIPYAGPMEPGLVHVIGLGVGKYDRQRLNFPVRDAQQLGEVLHQRGVDPKGKMGLRRVLTDNHINLENVNQTFREVASAVKGRPQDTVVVFLAGHTGVFDRGRFCLLLPSYPFPKEAPLMVAARGDAPDLAPGAVLRPTDVLPFSSIVLNLMRLDALNRLVIVDACQAEAILSDPKVVAVQKFAEIESRKARTSYLMAARRGEAALEVEPLGHGLFTFTLLRGMGGIPKNQVPEELTELALRSDADYNGDGTLTTQELDRFVKENMPRIAARFPLMVANRRAAQPLAGAQQDRKNPADQSLRIQTTNLSFPLFRLSDKKP
jgi:WD40 repeat protein